MKYSERIDYVENQKRSLTSPVQVGGSGLSVGEAHRLLADSLKISVTQVRRLDTLSNLTRSMRFFLDIGRFSLRAAEHIAQMPTEQQDALEAILQADSNWKITEEQARTFREKGVNVEPAHDKEEYTVAVLEERLRREIAERERQERLTREAWAREKALREELREARAQLERAGKPFQPKQPRMTVDEKEMVRLREEREENWRKAVDARREAAAYKALTNVYEGAFYELRDKIKAEEGKAAADAILAKHKAKWNIQSE